MRIGVYQNNPKFGEVQENIQNALDRMEGIRADIIVLPELFTTGYQFTSMEEVLELSEEIPSGPACMALIEFAASKDMHLVFGIPERDKDKCYNSAVLVGPDGFIGKYRKTHLFFEEKLFFSPGDTGFNVYDIGTARIGIMICFDWWFPESARTLALKGADIICHPANLVLSGCQKAMATRSLENAVYSVTANRVGSEARGGKKELLFTGKSQVIGPDGGTLLSLNGHDQETAAVEIDIERARDKSITAYNDRFTDRRPDLYFV